MATLAVDAVSVGYNEGLIIDGLTVEIPEGKLQQLLDQMVVEVHIIKNGVSYFEGKARYCLS